MADVMIWATAVEQQGNEERANPEGDPEHLKQRL
jgi:hypothetical protein